MYFHLCGIESCQVSSGWRPSEILSPCRVNAIGGMTTLTHVHYKLKFSLYRIPTTMTFVSLKNSLNKESMNVMYDS
ncbi:hypothetical protein V6Z12_A04G013800 [Gossypium hirsutum]